MVPATNEPETSQPHLGSFAVSPSPTPQQLDPEARMGRPRFASATDTTSPLDLRPSPQHLDHPEIRNKQRISTSMDANSPLNMDLRQRSRQMDRQHQYEPPPIGVDFTGYQLGEAQARRQRTPSRHPQPQQLPPLSSLQDPQRMPSDSGSNPSNRGLSPFPGRATRKRSHSNTERSSPSPSSADNTRPRLSSISSILNQPQQASAVEDMPIDPNLSTLPPQLQQHRHSTPLPQATQYQLPPPRQSTSSDAGGWELMEKKARLRRETEQMRELLKNKERELDELEKAG